MTILQLKEQANTAEERLREEQQLHKKDMNSITQASLEARNRDRMREMELLIENCELKIQKKEQREKISQLLTEIYKIAEKMKEEEKAMQGQIGHLMESIRILKQSLEQEKVVSKRWNILKW